MRAQEESPALVVVGAALGTGRWLAEHLLPHAAWSSVTLVDSKTTKTSLRSQSWRLAAGRPIVFGESVETPEGDRLVVEGTREPLPLPSGPTVVWFALPPAVLQNAVAEVLPLLDASATVVVAANRLVTALETARAASAGRPLIGVHALFDATVPSLAGQILYVVPDTGAAAPDWLATAVASAGGILKTGSAERHDETMALVQQLAHRVLADFADAVTSSELDLEEDVWAARTPLFETLFGLAVRVLDSRDSTVAAEELARIRDRFPGSLFDTIRGTAAAAVAAAQSKRLALARLRRSGELVGLRVLGDSRVRVGRIEALGSTSVTLEELMVGPVGSAALLSGPGIANAARLGLAGRPKATTFGLGHVEPVTGAALEELLDRVLAHLNRDVRFLVPESVAGEGVLEVVRGTRGVRDCAVIDEVVRTGQRSIVIRMSIRADLDPSAVIESLQERVAAAYRWPAGATRALARPADRVVYLGPAGTFSEDAAARAASALAASAPIDALPTFDDVLAAIGDGAIGVLPVSSSASGLVSRSIAAMLGARTRPVAGGMVDVAVRFDAYAARGMSLEHLRGATVFSHPQALAQCSAFIRRWGLDARPIASTAAALEHAAAGDRVVALAGAGKGAAFGLEVLEREVDDLSGSITRFLILGPEGAFGDVPRGSRPTLRRVWIGSGLSAASALLTGGPGFDELLADGEGRWLLVSSRLDDAHEPAPDGAVLLGDVPWSPRTPVVRA